MLFVALRCDAVHFDAIPCTALLLSFSTRTTPYCEEAGRVAVLYVAGRHVVIGDDVAGLALSWRFLRSRPVVITKSSIVVQEAKAIALRICLRFVVIGFLLIDFR